MRILRESPRRVTRMASVLTCLAMMAVVSERCTKDPSSPPGPPQPEIAVSPTSLSYSVAVDGSQTKSLVVTNSGKATLNVSSISVNASWLEGIMQSFSVSPGSAQEMMVTANAHGMSAGDYNATITIASNDPDEATKTVGVTFEVTSTSQPDIDVSPTSLSMDTVWTGGSTTATLTVQNVGNATLNVTSITDNQDWLSESPTSFSVNAGSSRAVTVTASAASLGAGTHTATITIASNDPDEATKTVGVTFPVKSTSQPDIDVTPTSLSMNAQAGGSTTGTLTVQNVGDATLTVSSITDNQDWLSESPTSFSVNAGSSRAVTVTASAASLGAGTYTGTIAIASNDPDEATKTVGVTFTVTTTAQPDIDMSPTSLSMTAQTGGSATATLTVQNTGNATLTVSSITDNQTWLSESPTSFSVNAGSSRAVTVTASAASLGAGTYTATITITSNDPDEGTKTVPVTFEVTSMPQPDIDVSPTSLSMNAQAGGSTTGTLTVQNVGSATLTVSSITDNQDWLSESPTNFSVNAGSSRAVTVTASAASLTVGTYTATITITSNDPDEATKTVGVTFTVTSTPQPDIDVSPTSLSMTAEEGSSTTATLTVQNVGDATLTVSSITDNQTWLSESPTNFSVNAGSSRDVTVTASAASLTVGTYTATITITSNDPDEATKTVGVTFTVTSTPQPDIDVSPTSLSMTAEEGSSTTATLTVQNVGGATLTVSSITDNQTWLSESPTNFSVNAGSSRAVTVTASAASLTVGTYTATITITSNDPDEATKTVGVTFTVTAEPEIWVNATYLEIEVNQGTQGEAWFEVKNVGGGTLQVTDMHDGSDDIWQSEQAFNLGPNESKWVGVYSGNWMYGGTYDFTITIDSNAGNATIELHVIINPVGGECSEFNWTSVHTDGIDYYGVSSDGWNGWAAGYRGISRTTNGSSWSELGVQDNFADIHVVGSTGFAVSGGSWGKVFRTYNGSDWDQVYAAEGAGCAGVFYDGGSTVWVAAGGGKVLKSTNTGGNWDAIQVGSSNVQLLSVFSEGNGVVWACGTSGSSCLYKSTNWGNSGSWSQVSVTNIGGLEDVWFSNGTGWLAGASGILYSSNGGGSWNQASVPVGGPFRAVQSDGWSSTCVHAVGGNDYSGFIIRSSDGGATWETEYTTSYRLMELVMGDTWGFVVGGNPGPTGGIWKGAATAR